LEACGQLRDHRHGQLVCDHNPTIAWWAGRVKPGRFTTGPRSTGTLV
jgi:hypothetical protein